MTDFRAVFTASPAAIARLDWLSMPLIAHLGACFRSSAGNPDPALSAPPPSE